MWNRRSRAVVWSWCVSMYLVAAAMPAVAQSAASVTNAVNWLNAQQRGNGTYGQPGSTGGELVPRDTARVVMAQTLLKQTNANLPAALAWLGSQGALEANQFLAEQAMALTLAKGDATGVLARLHAQRSTSAPDYGGFADYNGNSYDSALAMQAFASNEAVYTTAISGAMTTLLMRQNANGGWGFDGGFDSHPLVTAEVLIALATVRTQQPPAAVLAAAQGYLASRRLPNGSYGDTPLETAVAYRALALSGYPLSALSAATMTYLGAQQLANGSWNDDVFVTARVLDAYASNKTNLTINAGDFTLTPASVADGATVQAKVKVTNIGAASSVATAVTLFAGDTSGRTLVSGNLGVLAPGASSTLTINFTATSLTGRQTIVAAIDVANTVDEMREDDNTASTSLVVDGKPDLQVYGTDVSTSPSRLQPDEPATLSVTIRNYGDGDVTNAGYAVYDTYAGTEKLLKKATIASLAAGTSEVIALPIALASGTHTIRVVVDPDLLVAEIDEANNTATKSIAVAAVSRVDLRIAQGSLTASPARPGAGEAVTVTALVENTGTDPVTSRVAFYDGAPGVGGSVFAVQDVTIDAQSSRQLQVQYTTGASTRVIHAVADPDNLVYEMDERNNAAFFALTDQFADLQVAVGGLIVPKPPIAMNTSMTARAVVRNTGVLDATGVQVVIYDDLPANGGKKIVDTVVNVPAQGKVVVPATWTARAGQHFAVAEVNPSRAVFEADYSNNRLTKAYVVNGNEADIRLYNTRATSLDVTALVVNPSELTVTGMAEIETNNTNKIFTVLLFEDADGDAFYNPEVDHALGSSLSLTGISPLAVQVAAEGSVRFAPGKLYFYIDATNALNEADESNNIVDVWNDCRNTADTFTPGVKWQNANAASVLTPVARVLDTNADDVVDANDIPHLVQATGSTVALLRGDTGAVAWVQQFGTSGRQIAPVIADVDNDGRPEIIVHDDEHKLVALNADGTRKWTSVNLERHPDWQHHLQFVQYSYAGAPVVADLDNDGKPEVISGRTVLNGANGTIKWVGSGGSGRAWNGDDLYYQFFPDQEAPIAIDLNGDNRLEVIAGNTAYRHDGTIYWQRSDLPDGYTASYQISPANTRVCLVAHGKVYMLNGTTGATLWGPVSLPNGALLGGAPTIFTDANGGPWVGVAGDGWYTVFNASTGAVRWTKQTTTDTSFGITTTNAATAYDFGTGMRLVYAARDKLIIIRTSDGAFLYTLPIANAPFFPLTPVVADIDDDGRADIAVPSQTGLRILSDPTWNDAPSIWNELGYHAINVSDEMARIPRPEIVTSFSQQHFRAQTTSAVAGIPIPNLTASYLRGDTTTYPAGAKLVVRIGNNGWLDAPASTVTFYRVEANNTTTLLGTANAPALAPGQYADVTYSVATPAGGSFTFQARVDVANAVAECNETDNTSPNVTVRFSADVAVQTSLSVVSDPQPRPGETVSFTAAADVTGAIETESLTARFYLGDPNAGGTPISGLLPVTISSMRGDRRGLVTFNWQVTASTGPATIFVVFDPANAVTEDSETNNIATYLLDVSTAEPLLKLSAAMTLDPPSAEPGAPITVRVLVRNIGNVAMEETVLQYNVTGGAGSGFSGSATVPALAKYDYRELTLGAFTPAANGDYVVTLTPADASVTLMADPKSIRIAPFAGAEMTAFPARVPISLPLVQAHTKISRTNTIAVADDPMVPLVKAHIQKGLDWQAPVLDSAMNGGCYKCHVQAQGMVAFEASLQQVAGITVDPLVQQRLYTTTIATQNADGHFGTNGAPRTTSILGAWQLAYWHDPEQARPYLVKALDLVVSHQRSDGAFDCDHCAISFGNREAHTMMAMIALKRGYELTKDARYLTAINKAASWGIAYNYAATRTSGPEFAARVSIGLSSVLPVITDPGFADTIQTRVRNIAAFLASVQNADGSYGQFGEPDYPVVRTAQCLMAIALSGVPGSDPGLRSAILWLINQQEANGGWKETENKPNQVEWIDESTWAMIALPAAFGRLGQFDVDLEVFVPTGTELVDTNITPGASRAVTGGKSLQWRFPGITEEGVDLYMNLELDGIQHDESRGVTGKATITYKDPHSGAVVTRDVTVPQVTGFAPLSLKVETDQEVYGPGSNVTITETIANVGTSNQGITNSLIVQDANGLKVATVVTNEAIDDLPARAFPGWRYRSALTASIIRDGAGRQVAFDVDFAALLAAAGVDGTFDPNSIRVSADAAPSAELHFAFLPDVAGGTKGLLAVRVPDSLGAGSNFNAHVYFDVTLNGFKPVSMFNVKSATGAGNGLVARWWYLDSGRTNPYSTLPTTFFYTTTAPVRTETLTTTTLTTAPRSELWVSEWTGALYVPAAGTYGFLIGSGDGSWLYIDDTLQLSLPGIHGTMETSKNVTLTAGFHTFKFMVFNWCCSYAGYVKWAPPGMAYSLIPMQNLFGTMPVASSIAVGAVQTLPDPTVTRTHVWNTGATASGPYRAVGTIAQFGSFVGSSGDDFAISAASELTGTVVTDRPAYDPNDVVHATGTVRYDKGNATLENLTAIVSILDPEGATLASTTTPVATLVPLQNVQARAEWNAGSSAAGTYSAQLVVKDAQGTVLVDVTVPFEVRSTGETGHGVSGTISTPSSVYQGETLPITISILNEGNAALTDAPFEVILVDPATEEPVATIPFPASVAASATFTTELSHLTTTLKLQAYTAWLVSKITGAATPLSQTTFEVKAPPLKLDVSVGGPVRVLIWANCANGNSTQPCAPKVPAFITTTLTGAGIPWTLVGTQYELLAAIRTGAYDEVIVYKPGQFEAKTASEYLAAVHAGSGLIYINADTDADPKLQPALGIQYRGKLTAASTALSILQTPFTTPGTLTLNGDSMNVELNGAEPVASIMATQKPAIAHHQYGSGRVITIPYDLELTPSDDTAKLLLAAVQYVPRARTLDARRVVPLDFKVTPPPGTASSLTIEAVLPEGMSVVFAQPAFASGGGQAILPVWNVQTDGSEELHLYVWVRLPDDTGTYEVKGTAAFAGQIPVVDKILTLEVTAARLELESALAADLAALGAAATAAKDQKAIADASAELTAIRAASPASASAVLTRVLSLIAYLDTISLDTTAARADADRILVYWQSRA